MSAFGGKAVVGGLSTPPSRMTHHHHGLVLGNLRKLFGGHPLGSFRPLGGKSRCVQKLSACGLGFLGIFELTILPYAF